MISIGRNSGWECVVKYIYILEDKPWVAKKQVPSVKKAQRTTLLTSKGETTSK
jgi:hypothetical protein